MNYQIKMSSKDTYVVTEKEAQALMLGDKKGLVGVNSIMGVINMSFVESIVPEDMANLTEGYLHDGTKVVKKFGKWVDAANPSVKLDASYYPEIAQDKVLSKNPREDVKKIT